MTTETYEILDRAEHSDDPVAKQMAANFRAWIAASDAVVAAKAAQVVAHSEAQARVAEKTHVRDTVLEVTAREIEANEHAIQVAQERIAAARERADAATKDLEAAQREYTDVVTTHRQAVGGAVNAELRALGAMKEYRLFPEGHAE